MDPANRTDLQALLDQHGAQPTKQLGQHFLVDAAVVDTVVATAALHDDAVVLEIGPGAGTLTVPLAQAAHHVVAVEKDRALIPVLRSVLSENDIDNVAVVNAGILTFLTDDHPADTTTSFVVVGALPYYLSSRFFRVLLEESSLPWKHGVFVVQQEVAERIVATPPDMNLLALAVQCYAVPSIVQAVPSSAFWPSPTVDSAIIRLEPRVNGHLSDVNCRAVLSLARTAFGQKRKQLKNTLPEELLQNADIDPTRRPQTVSVAEWRTLARTRQSS